MLKLFYRAKRLKHEKQNNPLPFYTALLSVVLCMVCLAGTTWAWFTANQMMEVEPIKSAEWTIDSVQVYQIASAGNTGSMMVQVDETDYGVEFEVDADTKYSVAVSAEGNSSTGYLYVETCDGDYYTTKSDIGFELLLSEGSMVTITASWGGYSGHADELLEDECIGNGEVPVCSCDTLCTDEAVNEECKVCAVNHSACMGEEVEPVDLVCSCEIKCTEINESCEICKDSIENCNGSEENTQETTQETTPTTGTDTEQEDTVPPPESEPEVTESPTIDDSDLSEGQETSGSSETLETPETVVDEETTESTDIITESTSESESEDTLDTEDIATDANADKADVPEAVSDGDVETTEQHDAPEA